MSSSQQFPSGLNNWVDSDKPIREDFVQDNRLLDENALWKQDYDADGNVAQAGGISAYVQANQGMREADYDPGSEVKIAGGIPDYILNYILSAVYPVGSIYMSLEPTSPAEFLGGVWEAITGRAIVGVDPDDAEFVQPGATGGEKTHKLIASEIPSHKHIVFGYWNTSGNTHNLAAMNTSAPNTNVYTSSAGGDQPHNNMMPYMTAYIWKRTV